MTRAPSTGSGRGGRNSQHGGRGIAPGKDDASQESLSEVLASIRALVSAEAAARGAPGEGEDLGGVLMLTPAMRVDHPAVTGTTQGPIPVPAPEREAAESGDGEESEVAPGEILVEGLEAGPLPQAPILDEEGLRDLVNSIVREELKGELGEQIGRNLRKLIRRELAIALEERREG